MKERMRAREDVRMSGRTELILSSPRSLTASPPLRVAVARRGEAREMPGMTERLRMPDVVVERHILHIAEPRDVDADRTVRGNGVVEVRELLAEDDLVGLVAGSRMHNLREC